MYSKVKSSTLHGLEAVEVTVESDVAFGLPSLNIVGLPDTAIRESKERVRTAIANSGFSFPDKRVTVNLSPADVRKVGTHFDLPIAVCILESSARKESRANSFAFLGELALDGKLNPVKGIMPMLTGLRDCGAAGIIIPAENSTEASLIDGVDIYPAETLRDVIEFIRDEKPLERVIFDPSAFINDHSASHDFADVAGQESAKRALQAAAAGMHNVLMIGAPGAGKTMLARRLPSVMPPMTYEERLEVTKIQSVYGDMPDGQALASERPFRAPDHTVSPAALIGGGRPIKAGEVTLAHLGILFLDELPEFSRAAIESLRKPMEDEQCAVSRVSGKIVFPSKFLTVCAMNPCPCGYFTGSKCRCTDYEIIKYRGKISGPIMDRIDIQKEVKPVNYFELEQEQESYTMTSREIREKVKKAREIQQIRYQNEPGINCNAQMSTALLQKYCVLDEKSRQLLKETSEKYGYSARVIHKLLRLARTSADLAEVENIRLEDVKRILNYRDLDRSNNKMLVVN